MWSALTLLPNPLPELSLASVETTVRFLGRELSLPVLLLAPPTGPSPEALVALATARRLPLDVGDITPLVTAPAPTAVPPVPRAEEAGPLLFGEIPASALLEQPGRAAIDLERLPDAVRQADLGGLVIRLDFDEAARTDAPAPNAAGAIDAIATVVRRLRRPVLVRCASGIPRHTARVLVERGVGGLLVAGTGPIPSAQRTSPAAAEPDGRRALAATFADWGIPTVAAVRMLRAVGAPVISDGAITTGLDAAKALALGADLVTLTPPADLGEDALDDWLDAFAAELRTAMFLTGAARPAGLRHAPFVATGEAREWLEAAESLWRADPGD
ncbi:MAG: alpha-hydroxy-acid oxidizing protein [Sphaerobacter sp.]|nr:alpha-hydroxy-acid oxidizing protein [Sphaerobacter sp.]